MTNTSKVRSLPSDARVEWKDGMRPTAFPFTTGTVFISKGKETHVLWDGEGGRTMLGVTFTGALQVIK